MKLNYKTIAIISIKSLILGLLLGWIIIPNIIEKIISKNIVLKQESEMRDMWSKTPFPLDFNVYVFNITNPRGVENGDKPILKEIGPYYFEEWKSKENLEDDEHEDTVSYNMQNKFIFHPEKSNGLNGNEIISIPHILIQGIAIIVKRKHSAMLNLIRKSIELVFPNDTAVLTTTFFDIFFNGIIIDCSSMEFAARALCVSISNTETEGIKKINETHFKFSLLGSMNETNSRKYITFRGNKNIHQLGQVLKYDDETELNVWNGNECNRIKGTDGTIFPPFMKDKADIWAFSPELCRSLKAKYIQDTKVAGISASRYQLELGNITANEELQCFCEDYPKDCPVDGTMNLMSCIDVPLVASMPHFCHGASELFENIIGLEPNEEKHIGFLDFEIITGTPLSAAKRLQFNIDVEPVEEIEAMKAIRKMILPIFWIEERLELNKTYTEKLRNSVLLALRINEYIKWNLISSGIFGSLIAVYLYMKNKQKFKIVNIVMKQSNPTVKSISDTIK